MKMHLSHVSWNLAGLIVPLIAAYIFVPPLIHKIGEQRFGLLALAWGFIGYSGMLDLGIGRALTQFVARLRANNKDAPIIHHVFFTAERITLITGSISGLFIFLIALIGCDACIKTHNIPRHELTYSMLLLAIALPAHAISSTYRGMNEAYMKFKGISILKMILGILNFIGPYAISLFTNLLPWLVAPLVFTRLMLLFIFRSLATLCLRTTDPCDGDATFSSTIARQLFKFGGWATLSSILSPIMLQADRFLIAATVSADSVTTYVIPYEIVVQSLVLVSSVSSVVFPHMSNLISANSKHWKSYFRRWLTLLTASMFLISVAMATFLPALLRWWLKETFNPLSGTIGQVLCIGVFANAIGSMHFAILHAKGRSDLTAKLHLIELPLFVLLLLHLLDSLGVVGAAWAWTARMIFDAIALSLLFAYQHA